MIKKKINYGSLYDLNGGVPEGIEDNYISLWAQKMKEYDPDGKKADAFAEKYTIHKNQT